jgi:hypothetical protein
MSWVEVNDHQHAAADPLADAMPSILAQTNADHVDAMILLANSHAEIEGTEVTMPSVERLGFSIRMETNDGGKGARINFVNEVANAAGHLCGVRRDVTAS